MKYRFGTLFVSFFFGFLLAAGLYLLGVDVNTAEIVGILAAVFTAFLIIDPFDLRKKKGK